MRPEDALAILGISGSAALIYNTLVGVLAWRLGRKWGHQAALGYWLAVALGLLLFVAALVGLMAAAVHFRHDPPGSGAERQGSNRYLYVFLAHGALATVYLLIVIVSAALRYAASHRAGRSKIVTRASVATIVLFMLLTWPFVEFLNACFIGQPFLLNMNC